MDNILKAINMIYHIPKTRTANLYVFQHTCKLPRHKRNRVPEEEDCTGSGIRRWVTPIAYSSAQLKE
jgi:hypothetical protein